MGPCQNKNWNEKINSEFSLKVFTLDKSGHVSNKMNNDNKEFIKKNKDPCWNKYTLLSEECQILNIKGTVVLKKNHHWQLSQ